MADRQDRQAAAASQNEAEESDESEDETEREIFSNTVLCFETAGERTRTRVGRTRGGMEVAARIGEKLRREIGFYNLEHLECSHQPHIQAPGPGG